MIAIIYAGLSILPLGLLIFGSIFFKTKFKNLNIPVILSVGLITLICEFLFFNAQYSEAIDHKLWNAVSTAISYFPIWSSLSVIAVCIFTYATTEILKARFKMPGFILVVEILCALFIAGRIGFAKSQDYSLIQKSVMLTKPDCSEELLRKYADSPDVNDQLAVITNKNIPKDLILKLSESKNEMVRFYSTSSPQLSNERLQDMKTNDVSKEVRKQAENELKFTRLIQ